MFLDYEQPGVKCFDEILFFFDELTPKTFHLADDSAAVAGGARSYRSDQFY